MRDGVLQVDRDDLTSATFLTEKPRVGQMAIAVAKQVASAGNLANVDTPGFRAREADFASALDASLLLIPMTGFLPIDDPRIAATVEAIRRDLTADGLVQRYRSRRSLEGLPPGEGVFLACSFWLVDVLCMQGRLAEARALFEKLLALRNDVGLLAEEYDPRRRRHLGNFPQAFSHVALVNSAMGLSRQAMPAEERAAA